MEASFSKKYYYVIEGLEVGANVAEDAQDNHFSRQINERFFFAAVFGGHDGSKAAQFLASSFDQYADALFPPDLSFKAVGSTLVQCIEDFGLKFKNQNPTIKDGSSICGIVIDCTMGVLTMVHLGMSTAVLAAGNGTMLHETRGHRLNDVVELHRLLSEGIALNVNKTGNYSLRGLHTTRTFGAYGNKLLNRALTRSNSRAVEIDTILPPGMLPSWTPTCVWPLHKQYFPLQVMLKTDRSHCLMHCPVSDLARRATVIRFHIRLCRKERSSSVIVHLDNTETERDQLFEWA